MLQSLLNFFVGRPICWLIRRLLSLRYRVTFIGLDAPELRNLRKKGGLLFLPNHPALIDPVILVTKLWPKWRVRPMVVEASYFYPVIHAFLKLVIHALKVPNFQYASNSYKVKRAQEAVQEVVDGVRRGENFVVYPAGRLKRTAEELIGGSSAVTEILQKAPETEIVLVRTTGLWGSSFGWGASGKQPYLMVAFANGFKAVLKNLIFFMPRRKVTVELQVAPDSFPRSNDRTLVNSWLERWYNTPKGKLGRPGEPLSLVSYSRWHEEFPAVTYKRPVQTAAVDEIPLAVRNEVIRSVARVSKRKPSEIRPEMHLFTDIGLDSLDIAELIGDFEKEAALATGVYYDMLTVGGLMALVAEQFPPLAEMEESPALAHWEDKKPRPMPEMPDGETLLEAFLRCCDRMDEAIACADESAGVLTYPQVKRRVLLLAALIRRLPGDRIGIMLPSSCAAQICTLAVLCANKVPVMFNWTVGPRFLQSMLSVTGVQRILTSWRFLDRVEGIDVSPLHSSLVTLESLKPRVSLHMAWTASRLARKKTDHLLRQLVPKMTADDHAVILFSSGTESEPKAIPLTHRNVLSNQRAALPAVNFSATDCLFSMLPPFHSFGFTVTGMIPLMTGGKVYYFPTPTEGLKMAIEIDRFKPTLICSAPTFLKILFRAASKEQLQSLRLYMTGAEAASPDLFEHVAALDSGAAIIEGYGVTECSPILTINLPDEPRRGVGYPLPGVEIAILDLERRVRLGPGEVGLVVARGPNVFNGYLGWNVRRPFVAFEGREWYDTGDLGSLDEVGALRLAGRLKRFVKIGGEMIGLPALEEALIEAAKRLGWGTSVRERRLAVIGTEVEGERPSLHLFANFLVDREEANRVLHEMGFGNLVKIESTELLKDFPLMGSGKIDYRQLQERKEGKK